MKVSQRPVLWLASLALLIAAYTLIAGRAGRRELAPSSADIVQTFGELVSGPRPQPDGPVAMGDGPSTTPQVANLQAEGITLQNSLAITFVRVLFGLVVGVPLGILIGLWMGWSRRIDDYVHPIFVLVRSIPPLALITYIMLWLGHTEAHRLIPIVYAVATTMVIPTYHGVRDMAAKYAVAAQSLGARGWLLLRQVLFPAASPAVLGGVRYAIAIAWMTAVGAEMLMANDGMGNLLVGGGMWSSRLQTASDPAVIIVGILALAVAGWAMDAASKLAAARLTRWVR